MVVMGGSIGESTPWKVKVFGETQRDVGTQSRDQFHWSVLVI